MDGIRIGDFSVNQYTHTQIERLMAGWSVHQESMTPREKHYGRLTGSKVDCEKGGTVDRQLNGSVTGGLHVVGSGQAWSVLRFHPDSRVEAQNFTCLKGWE